MSLPSLETTPIPGLVVVRLDRRDDARGFFKENWQREKMLAIGLPDFGPVQNNVSFNADRGVDPRHPHRAVGQVRLAGHRPDLRRLGRHARGRVLRRDLHPRDGHLGRGLRARAASATATRRSRTPRPTPTSSTSTGARASPTPRSRSTTRPSAIPWPIPLAERDHLRQGPAQPGPRPGDRRSRPRGRWSLGAGGQLGQALVAALPGARPGVTRRTARPHRRRGRRRLAVARVRRRPQRRGLHRGRRRRDARGPPRRPGPPTPPRPPPWPGCARGTASRWCTTPRSTSSTAPPTEHTEDEPLSPLGVYAQSKAAGDVAVATAPRHYLLRTSWVIGEGNNFVRTMQRLAGNGVSPSVVSDQVGRLTFTDELVRATRHLLESGARPRHLPRLQRRPGDVVGRDRAGGLRALRPVGRRRRRDHDRGVRRRRARPGQALRPAPAAQRDVAGDDSRPPASSPRTRRSRSTATSLDVAPSGRSRPRGGRCRPRRCRRRAAPR